MTDRAPVCVTRWLPAVYVGVGHPAQGLINDAVAASDIQGGAHCGNAHAVWVRLQYLPQSFRVGLHADASPHTLFTFGIAPLWGRTYSRAIGASGMLTIW